MKNIYFGILISLLFLACSGSKALLYHQRSQHQIKWIAVQQPDDSKIPKGVPAEYLQKMLAYMLFQEKPYYVQPVDTTNNLLNGLDMASLSPLQLSEKLKVQGLLKYDYFDYIRENDKIKGFIFSISMVDLQQGEVVWRAVEEYRGGEDRESFQRLKQYMQSKVQVKSYLPYFFELYNTLKEAFQTLDSPEFTDDELTERLMNTTEPF